MRKFHDDNHANNRLSRCYIAVKRNGGIEIDRIAGATLRNLVLSSDASKFNLDSPDINYMFTEFGYVNTRYQCCYVTRKSKRAWKVGITPENLVFDYMYHEYITHRDHIDGFKALKQLYVGVYPTALECLADILAGRIAARAFDRKFCFGLHAKTKSVVLYYHNLPVGHYEQDLGAIILGDINSHLLQMLNKALEGKVKVLV